jgi:hypothetical protein
MESCEVLQEAQIVTKHGKENERERERERERSFIIYYVILHCSVVSLIL